MKDNVSSYVDYCKILYKNFHTLQIDLILNEYSAFKSFIDAISKGIGTQKLKTLYRNSIFEIIDSKLKPFKVDLELIKKLKEVEYYENSIPIYSTFLIFWIIESKIKLTNAEITNLLSTVLAGTLGYRLMDLIHDQNRFDPKLSILSLSLINSAENLLFEVFPHSSTFQIINKYTRQYYEVEYLEKANRWKPCPFSWENPKLLGYKAVPILNLFEVLLKAKGFNDNQINSIQDGWFHAFASIQLCDDIMDAKEDLQNGFETLVMSGYYDKFGTESVTEEKVLEHLTPERMKLFYNTNVELLSKARKIFSHFEQDLFLLVLEIQQYNFISSFELD